MSMTHTCQSIPNDPNNPSDSDLNLHSFLVDNPSSPSEPGNPDTGALSQQQSLPSYKVTFNNHNNPD